MYNGIGLQTARGSGTNGYVQTNKFFVRPKTTKNSGDSSKGFGPDQGTAGIARKANKDILEHDRKRQVELKLTILEDKLIDQGYTDAEIMDKLKEARASLEAAASMDGDNAAIATEKNVSDTQTHQIAARKEKKLETMRAALGISLPEDKEEKLQKVVDMDAHENDDDKTRQLKKGGSESDGEFEEGEIFHRNEDEEARLRKKQKEDLVSERRGHRSVRNRQEEEGDYKHKKGQSRKHTDKEKRRARSLTDTESDAEHSTDSEHDSPLGIKGKKISKKKFKKNVSYGSDDSTFDSDDSGDAYGRKGQGRQVHKHKDYDQRKNQDRKKKHMSESSDSETEMKKARESDSDVEASRKHRYEKSKKIKSKIRDGSGHSSDDAEEKHIKGISHKSVKSHKRHDSDDSDVEAKTKHGFEKSKKMKSKINDDSEYSSDDSEINHQRQASKKSEKGLKGHDSDSGADAERKAKYRTEKSGKSKSRINDAADYNNDDSGREHGRRSSKLEKAHKRHDSESDSDIERIGRSEKSIRIKSEIDSDSDFNSDDIEREFQRSKSAERTNARKTRGVDNDFDNNRRPASHKVEEVGRRVKRGRRDPEEYEPIEKSKRFEEGLRSDDEEHKDDMRGRSKDDEYRRKNVDIADNRVITRYRRDIAINDDREHKNGVEDTEYRRKHDKAVEENDYRRHRQDERERDDKGLGDDSSKGQRRDDKEHRRKREHENDYRRHRRGQEHGSEKSGRRDEDDHERWQGVDRDSSKRGRYEKSSVSDRRHRDHAHYDDDRWR